MDQRNTIIRPPFARHSGDSIQFMCAVRVATANGVCILRNTVLLLVFLFGTTKNGSRCIVVDQNKQFYFLVRSVLSLSFFYSHSVFPRSVLSFFMFGLFLPVCRQCIGIGKMKRNRLSKASRRKRLSWSDIANNGNSSCSRHFGILHVLMIHINLICCAFGARLQSFRCT